MVTDTFRRPVVRFAAALATVGGFYIVMATMVAFAVGGALVRFSEGWQLAFTLYLSVLAIVQSSALLVGQRLGEAEARHRDEAMHAKLDSLLKGVDKADDKLIGIKKRVEGVEEESQPTMSA